MLDPLQLKFLQTLRRFMKPETTERIQLHTEEEYKRLFRMAEEHNVSPIVYDGIVRMNDADETIQKIQSAWKRQAAYLLMTQNQKTSDFLTIYQKLLDSGVEALVVKGLICRNLYQKSDFRPSTDEDLLIRVEDFGKCEAFLLNNGFTRQEIEENNPQQEVSYQNQKQGLHMDIHIGLIPETTFYFSKMNREFAQAFEQKKMIDFNGISVYTLNDTLHFFYLLCHSFKHFVTSGVGVRQVCDILMMAEQYRDKIDWNYITETTKKYKMYIFWNALFQIGQKYLGFDLVKNGCPEGEEEIPDCDNMILDMLNGGIYGTNTMGRVHSANITLSAIEDGSNHTGKGYSLRRSLFPPVSYMKREYPYVKRSILLIPIAWIQRILKYLKKRQTAKKSGDTNINSIVIGKQRVMNS